VINDPTSPTGLAQREREVSHGRIPSPSCTCGFWFYKSEAVCRERFAVVAGTAHSQSNGYGDFGTDGGIVIGKVSAWGRAIEGADGYRSEFAQIAALVTPHPDRFAQLLRHYKVVGVGPKSKADEGLSTAWITKVSSEGHTQINLNRPDAGETDDEVGTFFVDPGVDVPRVGALVTVRFERRGSIRWISSFTSRGENGE
jgi:hypothetical protein